MPNGSPGFCLLGLCSYQQDEKGAFLLALGRLVDEVLEGVGMGVSSALFTVKAPVGTQSVLQPRHSLRRHVRVVGVGCGLRPQRLRDCFFPDVPQRAVVCLAFRGTKSSEGVDHRVLF